MITSSANPQIKRILQLNKKAKTRYEQRVFVVEGIKMCMEAPKEQVEAMYVSESFLQEESRREKIQGYSFEVIPDSLFRTVCLMISYWFARRSPSASFCLKSKRTAAR